MSSNADENDSDGGSKGGVRDTATDTNSSSDNANDHHEVIYTIMTYISGVLYYLSTCINPLLYNLMSNKFRQAFKVQYNGIHTYVHKNTFD